MANNDHLNALEIRLSHERQHLTAARTEGERKLRRVWITQIEKEIASEKAFLGIIDTGPEAEMSDDEILAELLD